MRNTHLKTVFENISSEEQAYWLGFIYADGSVDQRHKRLKVTLTESDENHLEKLKTFLGIDKPLYRYAEKPFNGTISYICKPQVELIVYSVDLYNTLGLYGITPNKSKEGVINLDLIPEPLHLHFWRGVLDGDGCIVATDKSRICQLTGTYDTCQQFLSFIKKHVDTNTSILPDKTVYTVKFSKTLATNVAQFLYNKESKIFLNRKYEKAWQLKGKENPVTKTPICVQYNQSTTCYDSIKEFAKQNKLPYKNVYYGYKTHSSYKEYNFVSAT